MYRDELDQWMASKKRNEDHLYISAHEFVLLADFATWLDNRSLEQTNILRQWFDSLQDTNPEYLKQEDYELAAKLYKFCDMRIPESILQHLNS